ncbi:hypothetical protein RV17_GL001593 [Enterococcus thailandicus]|nr:hypothetical protein RV17_GL001593 [Enterococcus thailandicus]
MERILIPFNFIYQLTKTLPIYWVMFFCYNEVNMVRDFLEIFVSFGLIKK